MSYKIGDKFIIEIGDILTDKTTFTLDKETGQCKLNSVYRIKGFNTLVFDENGLNKLKKYVPDTLSVGDEVYMKKPDTYGVITNISEAKIFAITKDGIPYMSANGDFDFYYKTGLHFDNIGDYLEV